MRTVKTIVLQWFLTT